MQFDLKPSSSKNQLDQNIQSSKEAQSGYQMHKLLSQHRKLKDDLAFEDNSEQDSSDGNVKMDKGSLLSNEKRSANSMQQYLNYQNN